MPNKQDERTRNLAIFESLLDAFITPDGRPLRSLLASDEPGSVILRSVYLCLEQDDIAAAIQAQYGAVKALALSKGWDFGKVTADLIMQELLIRQAFLDAMLRDQNDDSGPPLH